MRRVSFERTYAERAITRRSIRNLGVGKRAGCRGLVVPDVLQERRGRSEEQIPGYGAAEIQQSIVVACRPTDEHILQHLLDRSRRTRVANEIGAELALRGAAERHVVAEDLLLPSALNDRSQRIVGGRRLDGVVELDVRKL